MTAPRTYRQHGASPDCREGRGERLEIRRPPQAGRGCVKPGVPQPTNADPYGDLSVDATWPPTL